MGQREWRTLANRCSVDGARTERARIRADGVVPAWAVLSNRLGESRTVEVECADPKG
jgi:hypothetical protein